ncbi:murein biosynthesis integral membrane protein MurJ [Patescibacteria group bacterium]|nr:murein biosynthesis integral membrane protein MurJ [Patescibacteria group bacterium]
MALKDIWNGESKTITGAALLLGAASLASRFLGVLRDRVLAGEFGAGDTLDVYYAAFRIPDLIFNLLILGALSAGFIPVFTAALCSAKEKKEEPKEAWKIVNSVMNIMGVTLVVLCGLFVVFAPWIVPVITPGFSPEKMALTVTMTQIMMLSPIFLGLSNILGSILQSFKRFFVYSLAPIFYNIGIIIGALFFTRWWNIYGLALGVVLGAAIHMFVQAPAAWQLGFRYRWIFDLANKKVRAIGKMMIPRTMGLAASQINLVVMTIIASTLVPGSLAIFNLANNLQYFPVGIIGISFAVAAFPLLGEFAAAGKKKEMIKSFSHTTRQIIFFIVPASVLLLVLRAQIVRVLFGAGYFDWEDTILTADTLAYFALSLFAQALIPLLARFFYALQDTKTPFFIGLISAAVNILAAFFLVKSWGVAGLAMAFSIASVLNFCLLWIFLRIKFGSLDEGNILKSTFKISVAASLMAFAVQTMKAILVPYVDMQTFLGVLGQGFGAGSVGILIFVAAALALGSHEMNALGDAIKYKLFRIKRPIVNIEEGPR